MAFSHVILQVMHRALGLRDNMEFDMKNVDYLSIHHQF